jgi:gliding motility-associated-like protein
MSIRLSTLKGCFLLVIVIFLQLLSAGSLRAQITSIGGVVNNYAAVDSINKCQRNIYTSNVAPFTPGTKVLLIQMQGAIIDSANNFLFGTIVNYKNCGNYEFNEVASSSGNTVKLKYMITRQYTVADKVQLISVPVYANATTTGTLSCQAWNGSTGGVLALEVKGNLILNDSMDVEGKGFRGGSKNANVLTYSAANCGFTDYYTSASTANGAMKGEGIAKYKRNKEYARGANANGGGGGNQINSGGAGGAGFSLGGNGGNQMSACPGSVQGGQGGRPCLFSNNTQKVFMGGGGGAGHQDNSLQATDGASGGGIIFLKADTLVGNGQKIRANGADQILIAGYDGAGGGGGGGTVLLDVGTISTTVNINVKGGNGGNVANNNANCHGPGGGGGGGIVWYSGANLSSNASTNLLGGSAGVFSSPSSSCNGSSAGAQSGSSGTTLANLVFVKDEQIAGINAGSDTTICKGAGITLQGSGGINYNWVLFTGMIGANTPHPIIPVLNASQNFVLNGIDTFGCSSSDTVFVAIVDGAHASLSEDSALYCKGRQAIVLTASGGNNYWWTPFNGLNATNDSIVYANPSITTTYSVIVTKNGVNCPPDTAFVVVTVADPPVANAGPDLVGYYGAILELNGACTGCINGSTYQWSPNIGVVHATSLITQVNVLQEMEYELIVSNGSGCSDSDTMKLWLSPPELTFMTAFSPDGNGVNETFKLLTTNFNGDYELTVYNRWGQLVFKTNDPRSAWDGYFNGKLVEKGTYDYYVRYRWDSAGEWKVKKGFVVVVL